ncbi:hypothetical protein JZ751_002193 [Albula glossodonta]|uniref:Uncharacterized protein n=1 Tax=Albula glossodonta TaxID=121402 RepID=A0A8T2PG44_9TELE|nr:hypothetical protein JZ751_002193 [Albula glossodonta]
MGSGWVQVSWEILSEVPCPSTMCNPPNPPPTITHAEWDQSLGYGGSEGTTLLAVLLSCGECASPPPNGKYPPPNRSRQARNTVSTEGNFLQTASRSALIPLLHSLIVPDAKRLLHPLPSPYSSPSYPSPVHQATSS